MEPGSLACLPGMVSGQGTPESRHLRVGALRRQKPNRALRSCHGSRVPAAMLASPEQRRAGVQDSAACLGLILEGFCFARKSRVQAVGRVVRAA